MVMIPDIMEMNEAWPVPEALTAGVLQSQNCWKDRGGLEKSYSHVLMGADSTFEDFLYSTTKTFDVGICPP